MGTRAGRPPWTRRWTPRRRRRWSRRSASASSACCASSRSWRWKAPTTASRAGRGGHRERRAAHSSEWRAYALADALVAADAREATRTYLRLRQQGERLSGLSYLMAHAAARCARGRRAPAGGRVGGGGQAHAAHARACRRALRRGRRTQRSGAPAAGARGRSRHSSWTRGRRAAGEQPHAVGGARRGHASRCARSRRLLASRTAGERARGAGLLAGAGVACAWRRA